MSTREFFLKRWEAELPAFGKVLRAVPQGQLNYKPHEKCTPAGALAWQIAEEHRQLVDLLDKGEVRMEGRPKCPPNVTDVVAEFDRAAADLRKRLEKTSDKDWSGKKGSLHFGENAWSDTMENMFWGYLFDMVHHRGQLSAYLRPMGAKVPSIYGPSADDAGM